MPYIKQLIDCNLFAGVAEDKIEVFRPASRLATFQADDTVMQEGNQGETLLILIKGKVTISKKLTLLGDEEKDTKDKTFITLDESVKPFFGEMAMLMEDSTRTATVKALTDCEIVIMEKDPFLKVCKDNPAIGYLVMENISKKLAANLDRESKNVLKLTTAFSLVLEE
ncbi:MAG: cyclic nucleotide-binding domain-containing protein [Candidatus Marinimicrobia bacterium]|nr:cyclic nucleotide-binding domain-containing protein [Candidatus Neomarinimicrobiota bacterium]MCF7903919.1 cyclic nucleotide-binding domain-containing protein [Candidatus Neomarinimicrobiota bacterium]